MPSLSATLTTRMNFLAARQTVVAGNIANADTPGYLARDLTAPPATGGATTFAMAVNNAKHLRTASATGGAGKLTEDARFIEHNGNSVRLDDEMLKMNETQLSYRMMTQLYAKQVALQKLALGSR